MKRLLFHSEADSELHEAAAWYDSQQSNLGRRFLFAVEEATHRIQLNPLAYPTVDGDVRRCLTKTFPFGVVYRERAETIVILAIMHLRREPGYWKNRVSNNF